MTNRETELEAHLPSEAWKDYKQGLPVYTKDGEYLGRDKIDTSRVNNRLAFGTIGVSLLTALNQSSVHEPSGFMGVIAGIAFFVAPGVVRVTSRLVFRDKKIINP